MDEFNVKILNRLRRDGRISNLKLAQAVKLAPSAVLKRVRALERSGVLAGCTTRLDHRKLGLDLTVLIDVITSENAGILNVGEKLAAFPEICDVYDVSGRTNYIVKAVVQNTDALNKLVIRLGKVPGVVRTQSTLVMNTLKNELSVELTKL